MNCRRCKKLDITNFHRCDGERVTRKPIGAGVAVRRLLVWLASRLPNVNMDRSDFERIYLSAHDRSRAESCWILRLESDSGTFNVASSYPVTWILKYREKFDLQDAIGGYVVELLPGQKLTEAA